MVAERKLVLILVVFHPGQQEVETLQACLAALGPEIGYALAINEHRPGEPVDGLVAGADLVLKDSRNLGYGRAFNRVLRQLAVRGQRQPEWLAALNTDLSWRPGTMETLLAWLQRQPEVVLAVPQITDATGQPEALCKRDPTVLALLSRRFWPEWLKPPALRRYDARYVMADQDHTRVLDVPYLSGCCMLMRRSALQQIGGFDESFFLYLEDADLTRSLRLLGRCVHLPVASVCHRWGRGSHHSWWLTLVNLQSAWFYFRKWGWRWC